MDNFDKVAQLIAKNRDYLVNSSKLLMELAKTTKDNNELKVKVNYAIAMLLELQKLKTTVERQELIHKAITELKDA